jgi:hypothetical protein
MSYVCAAVRTAVRTTFQLWICAAVGNAKILAIEALLVLFIMLA